MEMLDVLVWLIYPYLVVAILGMGLIWQVNVPISIQGQEMEKRKRKNQYFNRIVYTLLILSLLTGLGVFLFYNVTDEPEKIFQWVMSLVSLNPELEIIQGISALSRLHLILLFTFLCLFSFSSRVKCIWRPVHFFKRRLKARVARSSLELER